MIEPLHYLTCVESVHCASYLCMVSHEPPPTSFNGMLTRLGVSFSTEAAGLNRVLEPFLSSIHVKV